MLPNVFFVFDLKKWLQILIKYLNPIYDVIYILVYRILLKTFFS